ncbi:hypothetical protein ACHHYP_15284 [Achlya hypogyna]|uniref:3'-phosphate/5'-hydroxy nucleic acid ligase n=1 Tax=Achlya hypogyna TaxID=1202772 RepID=A0A1V9YB56_ACHHY|nr:hypothetical protein ACHHYP_15284 [Achlya hypogyna]
MFNIGDAWVFLDEIHVDRETHLQIAAMAVHPTVAHVRVMPDAHKGNGCCVGFTCRLTSSVLPGLIGGDIGCGVAIHPLPAPALAKKRSLAKLDRHIHACVPMGNGYNRIHARPVIQPEQLAPFFDAAQAEAMAFVAAFAKSFGVDLAAHVPTYGEAYLRALCARVGSNYESDLRALGSLGGGNHFIEVNECTATGQAYVAVHTGSRRLGQLIARYHHSVAEGSGEAAQHAANDDDDVTGVQASSRALSGPAAAAYFFDMIWAQTYAHVNRRAILSLVLANQYAPAQVIESTHNYIDFRDLVVRKGAIRCHANDLCVVALNMRDGILLCRGRGNDDWNWSGPHGCGRLRGRKRAGQRGSRDDVAASMRGFAKEMDGVYSSCIVPETLDERPSAYRDAELIRAALAPTATVVAHLKTVLNVKGH